MNQISQEKKMFSKTTVIALTLLMAAAATATTLTAEYIILPEDEDYTVDQAVIIDETTGNSQLQIPEFNDGNIVGEGEANQQWGLNTNLDGNITLEVEMNTATEHYTTEEPANDNPGISMAINHELLPEVDQEDNAWEKRTIDLTNGQDTIKIEGETSGTVAEAIQFRANFPLNYNLAGNTVEEENLLIEFDAQNADHEPAE